VAGGQRREAVGVLRWSIPSPDDVKVRAEQEHRGAIHVADASLIQMENLERGAARLECLRKRCRIAIAV
jgi:hypothetical protein